MSRKALKHLKKANSNVEQAWHDLDFAMDAMPEIASQTRPLMVRANALRKAIGRLFRDAARVSLGYPPIRRRVSRRRTSRR